MTLGILASYGPKLPKFLPILIFAVVGFGLAYLIGSLLRRCGAFFVFPRLLLSFGLTLFTFTVGEFLGTSWDVWEVTGIFSLELVLANLIPLSLGDGDSFFFLIKLAYLAGFAVALCQTSKPKMARL